jgi:tetratricopeptide (TPR) repeat protein
MVQRVRGAWWAVPVVAVALAAGCASPEERAAGYASKAVALFGQGETDKAKLEARNALQLAPKNVPARWLLAQIADAEGEFGQMLGHLEVVIAEDPTHVPARLKLAQLLLFAQDYAGAQVFIDQLAKLAPDDPQYRMLLARQKFQQGDLAGGIALMDGVVAERPQDAEAALLRGMAISFDDPRRGLAELETAAGRLDGAAARPLRQARVDILSRLDDRSGVERELKALAADYPDGGYSRDLANYLTAQGRLDEAEQALRDAIKADPDNFDLKFALAQFISRSRQNPDLAEATLKEFIAAAPDEARLPILLGTFYEASNRAEEAMDQYRAAAARDPRSANGYEARTRIAALQLAAGRPAEARTTLEEVLAEAPDNGPALLGRGELNLAEGRPDDAIADLRGVLRKEPENRAALRALARAHLARGDATLAQDSFRRLLQVAPGDVDANTELARLLAAAGRGNEAEPLLRRALETQPNYVPAGSLLVEVLAARGDLAAAEGEARRLAALDDELGVGQLQLGRVLQARGNAAEAATAYRVVLRREPASLPALRGLVDVLAAKDQLAAAGTEIERFVAANPGSVEAELMLGDNLLRRRQPEPARAVAERVRGRVPGDPRPWLIIINSYGNEPAARGQALEAAVAAVPGTAEFWKLLATHYLLVGRTDDAQSAYERGLVAIAGHPGLSNDLAALLLDARTDDASFRRALALVEPLASDRNPAVLDTLGWAHYRLGDFPKAVQFLERALALESANPIIHFHLGMAYKAMNNAAGATQHLEKSLAAGDAFPGAREARAALDELRRAAAPG